MWKSAEVPQPIARVFSAEREIFSQIIVGLYLCIAGNVFMVKSPIHEMFHLRSFENHIWRKQSLILLKFTLVRIVLALYQSELASLDQEANEGRPLMIHTLITRVIQIFE